MARTTPDRPVDVESVFPELAEHRQSATRLHPRPGSPTVEESSVGGPPLWPSEEDWPVCRVPHPRGRGERVGDVRRKRSILAEAWSRVPGTDGQTGPTDEEREIIASLQPGEHAPAIADTDPIPLMPLAQFFARDVPGFDHPADCDLLQVFWCPFDAHGERGARPLIHMQWRKSSEVNDPLTNYPELEVVGTGDYVPEPCVLHPEAVTEHEYIGLLPQYLQTRIEAWEESDAEGAVDYRGDLSISPGFKIGGFATWHTTDPYAVRCSACGEAMRLLLTVASSAAAP